MTKNFTIGVLGGMGTYATIHLFNQYASVFQAEKEWDRPRIIIDNRCTMPSRVRAFLYKENIDALVDEMSESISMLMNANCTKIVLACNTSHLFLPYIYEKLPEAKNRICNIIDCCVDEIVQEDVKSVYLLASEGTIDSQIYQNKLAQKGIECITPDQKDYFLLRECIESVKQNQYTEETKEIFLKLLSRADCCILGCTELPILYEKYAENTCSKKVYDPLLIAIKKMKREFDYE